MTLDYNIFLEVAVIPLDIVLCTYLIIRYKNPTKVNLAFRRFAFFITVADIIDVATAIVTSARGRIPNPVHYFFNITDSVFAALSGFAFIYYVYAYVEMEGPEHKRRSITNLILLDIDLILLLTNPLTGWVFTYDSNGNYIHQFLFIPVAYGFPILFFIIGSVYLLGHREKYKRSQVVMLVAALIITSTLFLLQMLFFDDVLITFFIASIGMLVVFLSLETPDYVELVQTLTELHETRAREAAAQAKARLSQEVMLALSKAVDAKDHYTKGHSERVAGYAREIARRLGKPENEQEEIYSMGLLHDVGKIGVQEELLNKKGGLTKEEFDIIKSHTTTGWEILKTITEIPGLSTGARWHHERFDGTGYPDGLSGKAIPEEARIICLADCYDAMTSKRSYSYPRAQGDVKAEIIRCSGTQFDPDIAKVLVEMIDADKDYQLRELQRELEETASDSQNTVFT
ncbi:MAG: HD-GYP domain-containing protein [Lachnospiraceae bacterium]|nr:HD-GYP domain-containing protein [Lachnospiraceae bacterium]